MAIKEILCDLGSVFHSFENIGNTALLSDSFLVHNLIQELIDNVFSVTITPPKPQNMGGYEVTLHEDRQAFLL